MSAQYPDPQQPGGPTYGASAPYSGDPVASDPLASDPYGQQPIGYQPGPTSTMSDEDQRLWGALAHGAAIAAMVFSAGFLGFLGSLAVWIYFKDRSQFVRAHAANSLNVQITMLIWLIGLFVAAVVLGILTLGLALLAIVPMIAVAPLAAGVLHVVGAVKAYNGEAWNPPLTPRFIS